MRLPDSVVPQAVALHLQVDPDQPRHQGEVEIRLLLKQPVPAPGAIRLHAKGLQLQSVWLEAGAQRWRGTAVQVDGERVDLRFNRPLPAGPAVLQIGFSGAIADRDVYGLFRQLEAGQWAAFTQFQATGARRAFPLFDEPGWKLPWTLSLTVPQALTAVSNMPVASEDAARPGFKRVTFQPSPPMPSYLLAFGVGRFAAVDAGRAGQGGTVPLRIIVPAGREDDAAFAAATTGRILDRLEDWFGMPHPFAKLDSLSVPITSTFGAMEHAGLVTYASTLLLASAAERTPAFERDYVVTAAHELAHQWFGNLVTMAWWDDLWLNESFASWMEDRIANTVQPDWPWRGGLQRARAQAMRADRLAHARHVEQPVRTDDDMGNLWDAITYEKGQSVLGMFEAWTGPEAFRDGVRAYLRRHAWGSATSDDFFQALSATDTALPAAVRSFTRQGGIPRLRVHLLCDGGPPRLQLSQSRLLPVGAAAVAPQVWQLPLRLRTPAGSTRLLMATPEAVLPLPDTTCPAWVQANADGTGYWRASYAGDGLQRLAQAADLPVAEWLALLDDGIGLHDAGDIDNPQLLALVRAAATQPSGEVQQAAALLLRHLRPLFDTGASPRRPGRLCRGVARRLRHARPPAGLAGPARRQPRRPAAAARAGAAGGHPGQRCAAAAAGIGPGAGLAGRPRQPAGRPAAAGAGRRRAVRRPGQRQRAVPAPGGRLARQHGAHRARRPAHRPGPVPPAGAGCAGPRAVAGAAGGPARQPVAAAARAGGRRQQPQRRAGLRAAAPAGLGAAPGCREPAPLARRLPQRLQ